MAKVILPREAGEGDHAKHGGGGGRRAHRSKTPSSPASCPSAAFASPPPPPLGGGGGTIAEALAEARARLAAAEVDSAALDARLLLAAATGRDMARLIAGAREPLGAAEAARFAAMLDRRARREPVARILGEKEFWGLAVGVNAATLVPRPETEIVVEAAIDWLRHFQFGPPIHICDVGTGSGAIVMALLHEIPEARGTGIDISPEALEQAWLNAERLGLSERVDFRLSDFDGDLAGPYDLVVSNPPYVPSGEISALAPDVRGFDPPSALDGGADGLEAYRAIARRLPDALAPGGIAALELGAGQAGAVAALLEAQGMKVCDIRRDLAGLARAVVARK